MWGRESYVLSRDLEPAWWGPLVWQSRRGNTLTETKKGKEKKSVVKLKGEKKFDEEGMRRMGEWIRTRGCAYDPWLRLFGAARLLIRVASCELRVASALLRTRRLLKP